MLVSGRVGSKKDVGIDIPIGSMFIMYTYIHLVDFYVINVGKYSKDVSCVWLPSFGWKA